MTKLKIGHIRHQFPSGTRFSVGGCELDDEEPLGKGQSFLVTLPSKAWYQFEQGDDLVTELIGIVQSAQSQSDFAMPFEQMNRRAGMALTDMMALVEQQCGKWAWREDDLETTYPHLFRQLNVYQEIRNCVLHDGCDLNKTVRNKPKRAAVIRCFIADCEAGRILLDGPRRPTDPSMQAALRPIFSLKGSIVNMITNDAVWHVSEACRDYLTFKGLVVLADRE